MSRDKQQEKRRQKALAKKKKKRAEVAKQGVAQVGGELRGAKACPVAECRISEHWPETAQLTQILLARQRPDGGLAVPFFLFALGCMGVKAAVLQPDWSPLELQALHDWMFS